MSVYACADLHGQKELWHKIKDFLNPNDQLFFLGDAIDRGPDGYEIMHELLLDSRVIYIKGNHELMMEDALGTLDDGGDDFYLWMYNGGQPTFDSWCANGAMMDWRHVLKELPYEATYINKNGTEISLTHAGYTPGAKPTWNYDLVWDRDHLITVSDYESKVIVVHGHTPTPILEKKLKEWDMPYKYLADTKAIIYGEPENKIDIDCGSFVTDETVLLNLDTFKAIKIAQKEAIA